ncbi:hypothetical protein GCM10009780_39860 [Actinomadura alba]
MFTSGLFLSLVAHRSITCPTSGYKIRDDPIFIHLDVTLITYLDLRTVARGVADITHSKVRHHMQSTDYGVYIL